MERLTFEKLMFPFGATWRSHSASFSYLHLGKYSGTTTYQWTLDVERGVVTVSVTEEEHEKPYFQQSYSGTSNTIPDLYKIKTVGDYKTDFSKYEKFERQESLEGYLIKTNENFYLKKPSLNLPRQRHVGSRYTKEKVYAHSPSPEAFLAAWLDVSPARLKEFRRGDLLDDKDYEEWRDEIVVAWMKREFGAGRIPWPIDPDRTVAMHLAALRQMTWRRNCARVLLLLGDA